MTTACPEPTRERTHEAFPVPALVVMACTGFIVIMTETLPAGLLPQLAAGLDVSEGGAGQLVSAYAIGTVLAAIPAITLTRGARRKPLLLAGLLGFLVANAVTAVSPSFTVALVARFVGGAFSGLLWGMLAGYARRVVAPEHAGRALAVAMTGTPLALGAGTPLGAWLGSTVGWRWSFAAMSLLSVVVIVFAEFLVPDAPGQSARTRAPLRRVLAIPGVATVLAVVFVWMLAHNLLYTYIASYLRQMRLGLRPDIALLVFGVAALGGIWITGVFIDRALRRLTLASVALFVVAGAFLAAAQQSTVLALLAIVLWGLAFGGSATQLQTAMGEAAGENADAANAMLTTSFNAAIFAGGAAGAVVVDGVGAPALPAGMIALALVALVTVGFGRRAAFPAGR
ncbi:MULTISPECIES: MFS transporter [Streptomyces]|uniref:MFS transporter n=1 Tax=Streptomyces TaxID=1883 RepID=UPI00081BA5D6|nr:MULTISPECIES: MFS transporter [unclassified Streptomyces]MYQ51537.1 MFS transporter [Streptomyces sp. SID4941]SCD63181.1 Predicted arabinose efflux permease, MFS family [Streptomyces sp. PalvLS-984]SDD14703.1 Predicted arabinose efflux permease, MFS family [Streptomyces sp. AmelKG-A3]